MSPSQPPTEGAADLGHRGAPLEQTAHLLDSWLEPKGPVALHLRQKLLPIEPERGVIFPPTYADIGYNIDTLADGTRVVTIDSVGSQANRIEPIFKRAPDGEPENELASLVPQIEIILHSTKPSRKSKGENQESANGYKEKLSILELPHRSADAVVLASPTLANEVAEAFQELRRTGNAAPLCALAPTSLVFGVWDSRGDSREKRPRLVRAIIRAWDVETLHSAAQFNSVWKRLSEEQQSELKNTVKKDDERAKKGFADAPATFRTDKVDHFIGGAPNPEARVLGGVLAKGPIERDVTVNLVALRGLRGKDVEETRLLHKYLIGLSLLAATADIDLFLREGCLLRYEDEGTWNQVPRRGEPTRIDHFPSRDELLQYTRAALEPFKRRWPSQLEHEFDLKRAKELLKKKDAAENSASETR